MEKCCIICGNNFTTIKFGVRREYCFDCLPSKGLSAPKRKTLIRQVLKKKTIEYKGGKCSICGYDKCIGALQLHHRDPNYKKFNLSSYDSTRWADYKKEADKCDLLCANCHAELHWNKSGLVLEAVTSAKRLE